MREIFFPGINFREPDNGRLGFKLIPIDTPNGLREPTQVVRLSDLFENEDPEIEIDEVEPVFWEFRPLKKEFCRVLNCINYSQGETLSFKGKEFMLVKRDDLKPKTDAEQKSLIERYGTSFPGKIGDCTLNPDGTYRIRIGFAGHEQTTAQNEVLEYLAHEFGHTIGSINHNVVYEEVKAYAFQDLFMRYYLNIEGKADLKPLSPDKIHHVAIARLDQLIGLRMPHGAIIAHITGKRFGFYGPDSYSAFLSKF